MNAKRVENVREKYIYNTNMENKMEKLKERIASLQRVAVAVSGGVDSSYLLYIANEVLEGNVVAIMAATPLLPPGEVEVAADICGSLGVRFCAVDVDPLADADIRANPHDRCYLCKMLIFGKIKEKARELGFEDVCDGTNADDLLQYRPGIKALSELGIISPLADGGLSKRDIINGAREAGLAFWDRPSTPCLATRIPYDEPLDATLLQRIAKAEALIRSHGFEDLRVRSTGDGRTARIEIYPLQLPRIVEPEMRNIIIKGFHDLGFTYITIDLEGFRSGSMDL